MRKTLAVLITTSAALSVAAVVLPVATAAPGATLAESLPLAVTTQTEQDKTPDAIELSDLQVAPDSIRRIGSDGVADYWVGTNEANEVCLVAHIPHDQWVAGSTCVSIIDFYRSGVGLGLEKLAIDQPTSIEAYLLPADIAYSEIGLRERDGVDSLRTEYQANLVSVEPYSSHADLNLELERENGVRFLFVPLVKG